MKTTMTRRRPRSARQVLNEAELEKDFSAKVVEFAEMRGWRTYHTFDSRRSASGFPDLVTCRGRRVIFAELKSERGQLSPDQVEWIGALRQLPGAETYVWRPSDWDTVVRVLN